MTSPAVLPAATMFADISFAPPPPLVLHTSVTMAPAPQPSSPVSVPAAASRAPAWSHRWKNLFGKNMSVLTLGDREFLIGVQIAQLLKRETFNLYRSLKIKGIDVIRAANEQVDYLVNCNSIKRGTHSVTLVPYEDGVAFVSEERRRQESRGPRKHKPKRSVSDDGGDDMAGSPSEKHQRLTMSTDSFSGSYSQLPHSPDDSLAGSLRASADGFGARRAGSGSISLLDSALHLDSAWQSLVLICAEALIEGDVDVDLLVESTSTAAAASAAVVSLSTTISADA